MELALRQIGHTLVVSFVGRTNLEGENSLAFKEKLKALIGEGRLRVVIDVGNVGFIDSQGLGALISCLKVLRQVDGLLALANVSESVEAVLRITRLLRVFEVYGTVEEALRCLGQAQQAATTMSRGA